MISSNDFRPGVTIQYNNGIWQIVEALHVKPGKGSAFVRTKLKTVESGSVLENTFRAGEKVPTAIIEKAEFQYLYKSGDAYVFMDQSNYEQMELSAQQIGDSVEFLKDGLEGIQVMQFEGRVIGCELPNTV